MKLLFISGDDYTALTFERMFAGTTVKEVIEDLERFEEEYTAKYAQHEDGGYIELEVKDFNVDEFSLEEIKNFMMRSDGCYHVNILPETHTLKA